MFITHHLVSRTVGTIHTVLNFLALILQTERNYHVDIFMRLFGWKRANFSSPDNDIFCYFWRILSQCSFANCSIFFRIVIITRWFLETQLLAQLFLNLLSLYERRVYYFVFEAIRKLLVRFLRLNFNYNFNDFRSRLFRIVL